MPNPKRKTPPQTDNKLPLPPMTKSDPLQSATPVAEFGSDAWYAARWEGQLKALIGEIGHQEMAFLGVVLTKCEVVEKALLPIDAHLKQGAKHSQVDPWEYIVFKYLEAHAITQSLRLFLTACFEFFQAGFYPPERAKPPSIPGQGQPLTNAAEDVVVKVQRFKALVEHKMKKTFDEALPGHANELTQALQSLRDPLFFASKRYAPNFVLSTLIEQSFYDLKLLAQIYIQRSGLLDQIEYQESIHGSEGVDDTLLIAEELGRQALQPVVGHLLDQRYRSVFCYYGSRTTVRLLPYHGSVLLGMPYSTNIRSTPATKGHDLAMTAIPHEIGHVIYRFGHLPLAKGRLHSLKNRLLTKPYAWQADDWRLQWLEEIFADAYGCLVAGPISVLGFQMMLADGLPQPSGEELGDHPFAVLRPLLQSQILRKIRTQSGNAIFPEAPALLDARWQTWVAENWPQWVAEKWLGYPDQANFIRDAHFAVAGQTMTGQEILDALEPVLEAVLLTLESVRPVDKSASWTPNWEPTADNGKLAGLYRAFGEFANEVANQALAAAQESLQAGADRFQPDQALDDLLRQFADKDTNGWRARSAGIDGLIEMILFEGWSTEGPQAQHDR